MSCGELLFSVIALPILSKIGLKCYCIILIELSFGRFR